MPLHSMFKSRFLLCELQASQIFILCAIQWSRILLLVGVSFPIRGTVFVINFRFLHSFSWEHKCKVVPKLIKVDCFRWGSVFALPHLMLSSTAHPFWNDQNYFINLICATLSTVVFDMPVNYWWVVLRLICCNSFLGLIKMNIWGFCFI